MDNSYGFQELHEQLLFILDDIDKVCRKHKIEYSLTDGTLLGAIRHKGFIPWDDDVDICMIRSEFDKFTDIYPKEMRKDFKIGAVCNLATYSVINPHYKIPGLEEREKTIISPWVSVFVLDNTPESLTAARIKATILRLLSGMMGKPPQYANFPRKSRIMWDITSFAGKLAGKKRVNKWFDYLCRKDNAHDTGYRSNYVVNTSYIYKRYSSVLHKEYVDLQFEDRTYRGICMADKYLTDTYGDYMTPLPPDKRLPQHLVKNS